MSTPVGSDITCPSAISTLLPSTLRRPGAVQKVTRVLPMRVATALFTVAFGQVGAPETRLAAAVGVASITEHVEFGVRPSARQCDRIRSDARRLVTQAVLDLDLVAGRGRLRREGHRAEAADGHARRQRGRRRALEAI